ncbi:type II toxin-antitoxin system RelE/ParE family toxin [Sphingomonas sp.]|jgi:plasmid stabilization system protein ParE|uniref:type II toxin-antitoxin system RelE/ParE family toxin n=1 Tax=Sphingomonas sp. TaxID=28214 RepID=UPI002EDAF55F
MPTLNWTQPATDDLWAIDAWLEENALGEIAIATLVAIRARARFLENFPRGGRPLRNGMRVLRVINTPHLILYRLAGDSVEILRVHHEREDWFVAP